MTSRIRFSACVAAAALAFGLAARADAPRAYAIKGARLVTVSGAPIQSGTIVTIKMPVLCIEYHISWSCQART